MFTLNYPKSWVLWTLINQALRVFKLVKFKQSLTHDVALLTAGNWAQAIQSTFFDGIDAQSYKFIFSYCFFVLHRVCFIDKYSKFGERRDTCHIFCSYNGFWDFPEYLYENGILWDTRKNKQPLPAAVMKMIIMVQQLECHPIF